MDKYKSFSQMLECFQNRSGELFGGSLMYTVLSTSTALLIKLFSFQMNSKASGEVASQGQEEAKKLLLLVEPQIEYDASVYQILAKSEYNELIKSKLAHQEVKKVKAIKISLEILIKAIGLIIPTLKSNISMDYEMIEKYYLAALTTLEEIIDYESTFIIKEVK